MIQRSSSGGVSLNAEDKPAALRREVIEKYVSISHTDLSVLVAENTRLSLRVQALYKQLPWWRKLLNKWRAR
jgi:hypothetical protein